MSKREHITHSAAETRRLAHELLKQLPDRAVLALHGDLGSGKTCFVQGLAEGLGIEQPVTSPTFTLVHEYQGTRRLVHADLYRIRSADDAISLGLDEYFEAKGVVALEWAERAEELLPPDTLHIRFETMDSPHTRRITYVQAASPDAATGPKGGLP